MSTFNSYKDLDAWKKARTLTNEIYSLTKKFPKEEIYGLTSQMRRAAVSIPSNIAEGIGRQFKKETIQYQFIARASLYELETEVLISLDQHFISVSESENIMKQIEDCRMVINGFIKYLEKSELK